MSYAYVENLYKRDHRCKICQTAHPPEAKFCVECGERLSTGTETSPQSRTPSSAVRGGSSHAKRAVMPKHIGHQPVTSAFQEDVLRFMPNSQGAQHARHTNTHNYHRYGPVGNPNTDGASGTDIMNDPEFTEPSSPPNVTHSPLDATSSSPKRQARGHAPACTCADCTSHWPPLKVGDNRPLHLVNDPAPGGTGGGLRAPSSHNKQRAGNSATLPVIDARPSPRVAYVSGEWGSELEEAVRDNIFSTWSDLQSAFRSVDRNGDGVIDAEEFRRCLVQTFGLDFLTPLEISAVMARFDKNEDGYIDIHEFQDFLRSTSNAKGGTIDESFIAQTLSRFKTHIEHRFCSMKDAFLALDSDKDGFISTEEFETVLRNFGISATPSQVKAALAKYDLNGDGKVSHSEFVKAMTL
eukprot:TRINITY_DN43144_c0_g1_i1.p1 TRINITY_DN43144_c0_g1~~TRINITY_DN43144_c0_g1_i1.p1  ORF type:complete len:409 (-),score=36.28 TRINITY_DN43144_c0_g1_i1:46-1272(-)